MIQQPLALRIYAVLGACVCGVVAGVFIVSAVADGQPGVLLFLLVWLAFALTLLYRILRMSIELLPDELIVRNLFRTRRLARREVEGFRVGSYGPMSFSRCVFALLRDGTMLTLDVTLRPALPGSWRKRDGSLDRLHDWLDAYPEMRGRAKRR
jgi:hypothetical protein